MTQQRESSRPTKPRQRKLCLFCEGTPGGCEALHTIGGRRCCAACDGDHDGGRPDAA